MRIKLLLILLTFACCHPQICFSDQSTKERITPPPPLKLMFPKSLGNMTLEHILDFETKMPGRGYGYTYTVSGIKATIYLYNLRHVDIPDGTDSSMVSKEFEKAINDVYAAEQLGICKSVKTLSRNEIILGASSAELSVLKAHLTFELDGTEFNSFVFLTGYRNCFLKIRVTYSRKSEKKAKKRLERFLNDLGTFLNARENSQNGGVN